MLASALEAELRRRSAGAVPPGKDQVLAELVDLEAAYGKAVATGFIDRPEVQRAIRLLVAERLRDSMSDTWAGEPVAGEERARALHAADTNRFLRPEAWNVAWIRMDVPRKATEEKKAQAMARAVALRERAERECAGMPHFGPVAAEASADAVTRYRGGELGWMTMQQMEARMDPALVVAVKGMGAAGEVAGPVAGADGLYVLKLMGRRAAQVRSFDEVRPQLEHEVATRARREREERWLRWCREGVEVRVVAERLARVEMPAAGTNGVPAPGPMQAP